MRRIIIALVVLATSFVFALGLGEGVVRLYSRIDKTTGDALRAIDPYAVQVEPHGRMGYRQKPNGALHYTNGVIATANAMRFRGPVVPVQAAPGTTRIILLGGSTTHGWGVPDGRTIDVYMQRLLSERYPGRNFEVVNLALDGYDNLQNLERLRSDGLPLKPNIVVLNDGINDVRNAWLPNLKDNDPRTLIWAPVMERMRWEQANGGPTLWTRTKHYSVLARVPGFIRDRQRMADELATKGAQNHKASTADAIKADTPATGRSGGPPYPEAADFFEKYGRVIVQESLESGAAVLLSTPASSLALMPDTTTSTQSYWVHNAKTTQLLRDELARRLQRITADEQELGHRVRYVAPKITDMKLFLDDCHLTPDGFAVEAAILVDALAPFIDSTATAK